MEEKYIKRIRYYDDKGEKQVKYRLQIDKEYKVDDDLKAVKLAINDLTNILEKFKRIERNKAKENESWESVSK